MSRETGIEWTDATWNPIRGCSRVSEGCRNCYAETVANRFCGPGSPYEGVVQIGADGKGNGKWNGQIKFVEKHLLDPLKWKPIFLKCDVCGVQQYQCLCEKFNHRPRRIFVNSMSDLFHENVADETLDKIFAVMALSHEHEFQVLTKRPKRMLEYLLRVRAEPVAHRWFVAASETIPAKMQSMGWGDFVNYPLRNVRLGVSVENQKAADDRLDYLCALAGDGWKTMVSFEPLLSAVDPGTWWLALGAKTWAIVGGESGPGARPMHPDWARSLRDQCVAAGVPFFFKQWGEWIPMSAYDFVRAGDSERYRHQFVYPSGKQNDFELPMSSFFVGKKAAGRVLDGREWNEVPA